MMMALSKEMMQKQEKMKSNIAAQHAKLDELVMKVNTVSDADKHDTVTVDTTVLIAQRKDQRDKIPSCIPR